MILRQLEYLVALARERHFGRAAQSCGVTQPTLSAAIRELESDLDVLIVERGQRFQGFTVEGEQVLAWARRILADCTALKQEIGEGREGLAGRVAVGAIPTALASVGLLVGAFRQTHPRVRVAIRSLSSIEIQRGLDSFEIDAGITYLDNEPLLRIDAWPLYRERYFLVTADPDLFAGRKSLSWSDAASVPLCLLSADMQNRRILDAAFRKADATPDTVVETNSILAVYALVRDSGLASVLSQTSLHLLGSTPWLRALPLAGPTPRHAIGLVVPHREPMLPLARALIDTVRRIDVETLLAAGIDR
jgi:DNA-binding transcriptional LysR family regulator